MLVRRMWGEILVKGEKGVRRNIGEGKDFGEGREGCREKYWRREGKR